MAIERTSVATRTFKCGPRLGQSWQKPSGDSQACNKPSECCSVTMSSLSLLNKTSRQATDEFKGLPDVSRCSCKHLQSLGSKPAHSRQAYTSVYTYMYMFTCNLNSAIIGADTMSPKLSQTLLDSFLKTAFGHQQRQYHTTCVHIHVRIIFRRCRGSCFRRSTCTCTCTVAAHPCGMGRYIYQYPPALARDDAFISVHLCIFVMWGFGG